MIRPRCALTWLGKAIVIVFAMLGAYVLGVLVDAQWYGQHPQVHVRPE